MLREIPWHTLLEWEAFDKVEPIGGVRGDWQAASICSQLTNLAVMQRGGKYRTRPADWLLEYGDEKPRVEVKEEKPAARSWQELKFTAQMWVADSKAKRKKK